MRIGVVCASEERFEFFRSLVQGHSLARISPDDATASAGLVAYDGIFVDAPALGEHPALSGQLQSLGFVFAAREEDCPCVVRHDDSGRLHLQCGRQAAAKLRAAKGRPPAGVHTMMFQYAEAAAAPEGLK